MENSYLYKAHQAGRQAVKFQKQGLFSKAAELHLIAASLLYDLEERIPKNSPVICSLKEQGKYHKRQAELAQIVKNIFEKEAAKKVLAEKTKAKTPQNYQMDRVLSAIANHEVQILKNFDQADSLLQILSNSENPTSSITGKSPNVQAKLGGFTIRPRKDTEVIEELQIVNFNLRTLVDNLMRQLQECREENKILKGKLEIHEPPENKPNSPTSSAAIYLAAYKRLPVRKLPELAPLEEPDFDFSPYM